MNTIIAVNSSIRSAQSTWNVPEVIQLNRYMCWTSPCNTTLLKTKIDAIAAKPIAPQEMICDGRSPSTRPKRPAIAAPISGRKTGAT